MIVGDALLGRYVTETAHLFIFVAPHGFALLRSDFLQRKLALIGMNVNFKMALFESFSTAC
jgi:hypothetical protein